MTRMISLDVPAPVRNLRFVVVVAPKVAAVGSGVGVGVGPGAVVVMYLDDAYPLILPKVTG
jgi:hypothetical protein